MARRGVRLAFGIILSAVLIASPLSARAATPQDVTITIQRVAAINGGMWSATQPINDSGNFVVGAGHFDAFGGLLGGPPPVFGLHFFNTLTGQNGTITVELQVLFTPAGSGLVYEVQGSWLVDGATGSYTNLHGEGRVTGLVDFSAQTRDLTLIGEVH
jgi:uncharacterized membrane protein YfcA